MCAAFHSNLPDGALATAASKGCMEHWHQDRQTDLMLLHRGIHLAYSEVKPRFQALIGMTHAGEKYCITTS